MTSLGVVVAESGDHHCIVCAKGHWCVANGAGQGNAQLAAEFLVGRHTTSNHDGARRIVLIRQHRLIHQCLYRYTLEARRHIMALLRRNKRWELVRRKRGIFAYLGLHSAQHGRLEA